MSISAEISVRLSHATQPEIIEKIIQQLISFGWNVFVDGYTSYLPIGDKDNFDWQSKKNMNLDEIIKILRIKNQKGETAGVIMTWKYTEIGGSFLFWPSNVSINTFSMNLDGNRQKIFIAEGYEITDFQWYLAKLLPPLSQVWTVEYFSCDEHI